MYVAGLTDSPDLPVRNAFQARFQSPPCQGDLPCPYDAFVTKLAPTGQPIVYSTYLGGHGGDLARGIDVDDDGNAYVTGSTQSPDFPKVRAFQNTMRGEACGPPPGEPCRQAFLTKLNPSGATAPTAPTSAGGNTTTPTAWPSTASTAPTSPAPPSPPTSPPATPCSPPSTTAPAPASSPRSSATTASSPSSPPTAKTSSTPPTCAAGPRTRASASTSPRNGRALVAGRTDSTDFLTTPNAAQPDFGGYIDGFALQLRPNGTPSGPPSSAAPTPTAPPASPPTPTATPTSPDGPSPPTSPPDVPFQPTLKDQDYDAFVVIPLTLSFVKGGTLRP